MKKQRIYYGGASDIKCNETIFAVVTGQMSDGTFIYTEVEQKSDGSVVIENGNYKLLLDNQYTRTLRYGCQYFIRL